ncbi:hypothetical protein EJ08DRAFT_734838 [Tothia fuscella]|uniref:Uncharacterized protein n=1 Tax=Tothia fuscella TaxID=1048955 RepID=A0A9P4TXW8_9PEZI|nr:hypothetical protein EJ08DRAFT_734838 [Tothia fuscella]
MTMGTGPPPGVFFGCNAVPGTFFHPVNNSTTKPSYSAWTPGQTVQISWAGSESMNESYGLKLVPIDEGYGYGEPITVFDNLHLSPTEAKYDEVCNGATGRRVKFSIPYNWTIPTPSASDRLWYRLYMTAAFSGNDSSSFHSNSSLIRLGEKDATPLLADIEMSSGKFTGGSLTGVVIFGVLFAVTNAIVLLLATQNIFQRVRSTRSGIHSKVDGLEKPERLLETEDGYTQVDSCDPSTR